MEAGGDPPACWRVFGVLVHGLTFVAESILQSFLLLFKTQNKQLFMNDFVISRGVWLGGNDEFAIVSHRVETLNFIISSIKIDKRTFLGCATELTEQSKGRISYCVIY